MKNRKTKKLFIIFFSAYIAFFSLMFVILPKKDTSVNEKRKLAQLPAFSFSSLADGSYTKGLEDYFSDHFPWRDFFVGLNSYAELFIGKNGSKGVYKCKGGYLITAPVEFDEKRTKTNLGYLDGFAKKTGLPSSLIIVPEAGYILSDLLPKNHMKYRDGDIMTLAERTDLNIISVSDVFYLNQDKIQFYYKTDHHLTSEGSMLMYELFCKNRGITSEKFVPSGEYDGFYGTAYSKSGLWLEKPDGLRIYKAENEASFTVTVDDGEEKVYDSLFFESHLDETDKYPVFLDGNHSLVTVKNNSCHNGKRLLLVKDSYAHCFTCFLAQNYEEICMADLRYYRKSVQELVKEHELNEILYLFGAENIASSTDMVWISM